MLKGMVQGGQNRCNNRRWNALDPDSYPSSNNGTFVQDGSEVASIEQRSREIIVVRDSCDVTVTSTETQVAASLQAALQVAIALVVNISIADDAQAEKVTQELLQLSRIQQVNKQSVIIENSRDVDVRMTDTDIAVSIQLMLQLLLALLVQLDVF